MQNPTVIGFSFFRAHKLILVMTPSQEIIQVAIAHGITANVKRKWLAI
jgi:hypothetical protein